MNKPSKPSAADDLLAAYLAEGDSALPDDDGDDADDPAIEAQLAAYLQGDSSLGPTAEEREAAEAHRKRTAGSTLFGAASPSWKRSVSKPARGADSRPARAPAAERQPFRSEPRRPEPTPQQSAPEPPRWSEPARQSPAHSQRETQSEAPGLDDDSVLDLNGFSGPGEAWDAEPARPSWLDDDLGGEHFDSAIDLTAGKGSLDRSDDPTEYGQLAFDPAASADLGDFALDPEFEAGDAGDDGFDGFDFDDEPSAAGAAALAFDDSQPPLAVPGIVRSESAIGARPAPYSEDSGLGSDPAFDNTAAGTFDANHNIVSPSPFNPDEASGLGDGSPSRPTSNPGFDSESEFEDLYGAEHLDIDPEYLSDIAPEALHGGDLADAVAHVLGDQLRDMESRLARRLGAAETRSKDDASGLSSGLGAELVVLPADWGISQGSSSRNTRTGRKTRVDFFLNLMRRRDSNQLHLHVGHSPLIRVDEELVPLRFRYIVASDWDRLIQPICPPGKWPMWLQDGDAEFYYDVEGIGRLHVSLFRERDGAAAVFEMIPANIPSLDALALPQHLERLADLEEGLVLICGASGSGTSTTTASLVDSINQRATRHIVTVEDPIDYVYVPRKSVIHQREVGVHVPSFESAMRAVVRESADVIVLGALRAPEVTQLALEAVETGALVFAVVNTRSTAEALDRLVGSFPEDERGQARDRIADALRVAIAQQLVVTNTGAKAPALEILLNTLHVARDIRAGRFDALAGHLAENRGMGMSSMDQCLFDMWKEDVITQEIALDRCYDRSLLSSLFESEAQRAEAERREHQAARRAAEAAKTVGHDDETAVPGTGRYE